MNAWVLALLRSVGLKVQIDLVANSVATADTPLGCLLGAVLLVLFALSLSNFLDALMSDGELLLDLVRGGVFALHPWVADNVSHRKSLVGVQLEHARDQILELLGEEAGLVALAVHLPEKVSSVRGEQLIEGVGGLSLGEGWVLGVQDKQNNTEGEEVDDVALVGLLV